MSITILETLQNADHNLNEYNVSLGRCQLRNAVALLNKGYPLDQDITMLVDEYESLELIPYVGD